MRDCVTCCLHVLKKVRCLIHHLMRKFDVKQTLISSNRFKIHHQRTLRELPRNTQCSNARAIDCKTSSIRPPGLAINVLSEVCVLLKYLNVALYKCMWAGIIQTFQLSKPTKRSQISEGSQYLILLSHIHILSMGLGFASC